jgi:hypothetical protein
MFLKELVSCLNRTLWGRFLREICSPKKCTPFSCAVNGAIAWKLITRSHSHRNNKSISPNLLNTEWQRPKYIDDAKLNNRNKHSVLYTTIRHAIRHNTPCLTTLSHDSVSRLCLTTLSHDSVSRLCLTPLSHYSVSLLCLTTLSHDSVSQLCLTTLSHDSVSRPSSLRCSMQSQYQKL